MDKSADISAIVEEHIRDGDTVFVGGFGHCVPFALGFEIIRQDKKDLTLCRSGTDILFDIMIGAGVASKVVFGYLGNPGIGLGHAFRRAVKAGTLAYEDWTNMAIILRLEAARQGVPFLPSRILQLGDIAGASIEIATMDCPYTGEKLACIPALKPDVALVHAQQADKAGNIQLIGVDGDTITGALASEKVLVSVERFVDEAEIQKAPEATRIPAHRTTAVAEIAWGAHPSYVEGCYGRDDDHFFAYDKEAREEEGLAAYLARYIHDCADHGAYLDAVGSERLAELEAQSSGRTIG
ncbi:MAG TPA: 3-oxoadipate--succinyl-CoA transferase subunit A [Rhodospirillaceae bacterium]|nr:3-oxoadipate--succinyl-CoA transferase subunit A [Rhodospirillaceae bacterium]HAA92739.1 3-oxoadipate--succinyl-CoA transferase subunit A [Rhodospirillaceae bacterium]HAT34401.1 3-oxoadipate--succinyl-CoA transferase subunit A [Rhodospirillaceae bacterium]